MVLEVADSLTSAMRLQVRTARILRKVAKNEL